MTETPIFDRLCRERGWIDQRTVLPLGQVRTTIAPQRLTAYDVILGAPEQAERYELRRTT